LLSPKKDFHIYECNKSNKHSTTKLASNTKNNSSNTHFNLELLGSKYEAATQTLNNFFSILDEKNSTENHSAKESQMGLACRENQTNKFIQNEANIENVNKIKLVNNNNNNNDDNESENTKREFTNLSNKKKSLIENLHLIHESSNGRRVFCTSSDNYYQNRSKNDKKMNKEFSSLTRLDHKSFTQSQKRGLFKSIKRSNFFIPAHDHVDSIDDNEKQKNGSTFGKTISTPFNCLLDKKFNNVEFNKEIFHNSKILRENLFYTLKDRKKRQTSHMPDNPKWKRKFKIKISNNVKM